MVIIGSGESDTSTMHSRATRRDTRNAPENDDRCDTRYTHTLAISHGLAMRAMDDRTRETLTSEARFFAFQTRESGVHVALSFSCGRVIILANPLSLALSHLLLLLLRVSLRVWLVGWLLVAMTRLGVLLVVLVIGVALVIEAVVAVEPVAPVAYRRGVKKGIRYTTLVRIATPHAHARLLPAF